MSQLAGTATLARLALRRDRLVMPACVLALTLVVISTASSFESLYPTAAERADFAATIQSNSSFTVLYGPGRALDTIGGLTAWRIGVTGSVVAALMSLLLVGRHTRADEELGRTELLLARPVGRFAPVTAAIAVVALMDLALVLLVALGLIATGQPAGGSLALGAWLGGAGLVFAGVGAVAAQLTESARPAHGIGAAVLGVAFGVRAIGDSGDGTLTWLSPIGWGEQLHAYSGDRWWPLLLFPLTAALLAWAAFALQARRDLGAGLLPTRPGPPRASRGLVRPLGLALRMQRGSLIGWSAGMLIGGLTIGALGQNVADLLDTSKTLEDLFTQAGATSPADDFFASMTLLLALIGTGFTISSALRPRGEESSGRAESLLATALGRVPWLGANLAIALGGTVVLLAVAGLGLGVADAIGTGDAGQLPRMLGATLAQAPAVWVMGAVAAALFGLVPRATAVAWVLLGACVLLWFVGPLTDAPAWLLDLSPYQHVPARPAVPFAAGPLLALAAVAAALTALGVAAFTRRDVG